MGPQVQCSWRKADAITLEVLQSHFHLPMVQVAKKLDVCLTYFKRICRSHGVLRWPYRKLKAGMRVGADCVANQSKPISEMKIAAPQAQVPAGEISRYFRSVDFSVYKLSEMTPLDIVQIPSCPRGRIEEREGADSSSTIPCSQDLDSSRAHTCPSYISGSKRIAHTNGFGDSNAMAALLGLAREAVPVKRPCREEARPGIEKATSSHILDDRLGLVPSSDRNHKQPSAFSRPMARNRSPAAAEIGHLKLPGMLPPRTDMHDTSFLLSGQLPMPATLQDETTRVK